VLDLPHPDRANRDIERYGKLCDRCALGAQGFCDLQMDVGIVDWRAAGIARLLPAVLVFRVAPFFAIHDA
jgi:hypothetical protein